MVVTLLKSLHAGFFGWRHLRQDTYPRRSERMVRAGKNIVHCNPPAFLIGTHNMMHDADATLYNVWPWEYISLLLGIRRKGPWSYESVAALTGRRRKEGKDFMAAKLSGVRAHRGGVVACLKRGEYTANACFPRRHREYEPSATSAYHHLLLLLLL